VVNDAMDLLGGAGICRGPRNVLAQMYQAVPIGITVEGANILTRSMIVFGQGAIRCHPFVQSELAAAAAGDARAFDRAFFGHVNFVFTNAARAFFLGLSGAALATPPVRGPAAPWFQQLSRYSAAFALVSDFAMGTLGGALKRKEHITGRLSDALAHLYLGSALLWRFARDGSPERDHAAARWASQHCLFEIQTALAGVLDNLPNRPAAWLLRGLVFPFGQRQKRPSDASASRLARALVEGGPLRAALSPLVFVPPADRPGLGQLESALQAVLAARPAQEKLKRAQREGVVPRSDPDLEAAVLAGVLTETECALLTRAEAARAEAIAVDSFEDLSEGMHAPADVEETAQAF
jgi:acyl-CoA dehydrogenase